MTAEATLRLALVGNPNCGKSALFNKLTGGRQKVANYPGVTVERRSGRLTSGPKEKQVDVIDLPGSYALTPNSADEAVTRDVLLGKLDGELPPDVILCVIDATNLRFHLPLVLELKHLGRPLMVALNMMDLARRDGVEIDPDRLSRELGVPVVPTVAVRRAGTQDLIETLRDDLDALLQTAGMPATETMDIRDLRKEARRIASAVTISEGTEHKVTRILDEIFLNRVFGPLILASLLFLMFQAVFAWAATPMDWIDASVGWLQAQATALLPGGYFQSLIVDGILAGVGSVVIFLPQIIILFAFILVLEASGYMARAAFLMDKLMASVGLNGRAFIPLLSSFACAIPGIMSARTIDNQRDRLTTILIAPLMTCSARLPVYTLIIAAFIPSTTVMGGIGLQGLVMFALYGIGILSALLIAGVLKRTLTRGPAQPLLLELPKYQLPRPGQLLIGLWERVRIFIRRAGTIILVAMIVLWALASFPAAPADATQPAIHYSAAAWLGRGLEVLFAPIGFNWEISIALVPGMAAREIAVGALGTVYALSGSEDVIETSLRATLQSAWSLPTALAFLAWYVFAPQCLSTLAVTKRETNSWRWPLFMASYMFALAYVTAGITYWTARALIG